MKLLNRLNSVFSFVVLCTCIVVSILFCFEMKSWGFSQMELAIIFLVLIGCNYGLTSLVLCNQNAQSTLSLTTILMLLFVILQIVSMSFLEDFLKVFFAL